jgi:glyoxylase-like metal-dependent hydrolase (beta-lactamase superfamily II)
MRCLLVEDGKRLTLIDTGIGNKQNARFFSHYHLQDTLTLDQSLAQKGFHRNDITDVLLTHLHFDHCGGTIEYNDTREHFQPAFPNAKFWSNDNHWKWATEPNPREKASFLQENIMPIQESGQLQLLQAGQQFHKDIDILFSKGHTQSMMHPLIPYKGTKVLYLADVIPTQAHLPIPYVMGYDVRPLDTMKEKTDILNMAVENKWVLYFEHDPFHAACTVQQTEKGIKVLEQIVL